tara:strand:+ start:346 stop:528 length:183 start_codon:yes stop_codon:yes gene_type:complete
MIMTGYLVYSIYCYIASFISWRVEKLFKTQGDDQKTRIFFILKHGFRVTGTVLLLAHLLS